MCKFIKPEVPQGASDDERRAIYFNALNSLDLSDKVEKRDQLSYLSWANAWAEFKAAYPSATYRILKDDMSNLPYFSDPNLGIIVYTEITVDGITHQMWLPVMNGANKALRLQPYTYSQWDKDKKQYVEKTVPAATMMDINKTLMRCLVKNMAMFGLGLYIYAGEDLPETSAETAPTEKRTTARRTSAASKPAQPEKYAGIKAALSACNSNEALMELYNLHRTEVEGNAEIKLLFTNRKLQIAA